MRFKVRDDQPASAGLATKGLLCRTCHFYASSSCEGFSLLPI